LGVIESGQTIVHGECESHNLVAYFVLAGGIRCARMIQSHYFSLLVREELDSCMVETDLSHLLERFHQSNDYIDDVLVTI